MTHFQTFHKQPSLWVIITDGYKNVKISEFIRNVNFFILLLASVDLSKSCREYVAEKTLTNRGFTYFITDSCTTINIERSENLVEFSYISAERNSITTLENILENNSI